MVRAGGVIGVCYNGHYEADKESPPPARQPDTLADWQCVVNMCLWVPPPSRKPLPLRLRAGRVMTTYEHIPKSDRFYPPCFPSIHAKAAEAVFNLNFAARSLSVINLSACQALDAAATRLQVCGVCRSGVVRLLLRGRRNRRPYNARICPIMIRARRESGVSGSVEQ